MTQTVERSALARDLMPLVNDVAAQVARRVPMHVGLDELVAAGALGLAGALTRFDPLRADTFRGYAESRIRGAIMDELRHRDIMSRDARIESKKLQRSVDQLTAERGRQVADEEVADHLGVDLEAYWSLQLRLKSARMVSAEELELLDEAANPFEQVCDGQARALLADCIRALPERQALVLWLYYYEELALREIAEMLGVTASRVCQIRGEAVEALRQQLEAEEAPGLAA